MKLLALLHRWTGGITGLLLAVIGLSGTVLVWEEAWISQPGADEAYHSDPAMLGTAVEVALAESEDLSRITFAGEEIGLHQAVYADGSGAYITQGGEVVDRWSSMWGRPELWLFDLHHYLFMGETGKYLTGVLGLLLFGFSITGIILWWRTRRTFRFRLWPARFTRSAIVRQHRDIGVIASPLLILAAVTGTLMIFKPLSDLVLSPFSEGRIAPAKTEMSAPAPTPDTDWAALLAAADAEFPGAAPRRLHMPASPGEPVLLRMKQDFEWTPNGRTYVYLDPAGARAVGVEDPASGDGAQAIQEKFYPLHAGKVGGWAWKLALTFCGFVLVILGSLATWSFWFAEALSRKGRGVRQSPGRGKTAVAGAGTASSR